MKIRPVEQRRAFLLERGVPAAFLDAVDRLKQSEGPLRFMIQQPDGAYHYLPTISHYQCIAGHEVTPVFDGSNGDVFHVHLARGAESRFVRFELEQNEIYDDYGSDFQRMLADVMIALYEFADEMEVAELARFAAELGFVAPQTLFAELAEAGQSDARNTFESDAQWRAENLPRILAARR